MPDADDRAAMRRAKRLDALVENARRVHAARPPVDVSRLDGATHPAGMGLWTPEQMQDAQDAVNRRNTARLAREVEAKLSPHIPPGLLDAVFRGISTTTGKPVFRVKARGVRIAQSLRDRGPGPNATGMEYRGG